MNSTAPVSQAAIVAADSTLALLWERMRQRGDMPGFTRAIGAILCAMRGEDDAQFNMTRTVLSDPVLTQKVLRLANSAMYSAFGQRISTVSRAVLVLGTEAIGHLALGLKVIEEVAGPAADTVSAHAEMEKAVLAGMVARRIADATSQGDGEEAVVCAMLHSLGRMIVTYYLPERWSAMQERAGQGLEERAAHHILGLSLEDIGRATAQHWGFPGLLVDSMRDTGPRVDGCQTQDEDWLATVSTLSARCAEALWRDDLTGHRALRTLAAGFATTLGLTPGSILQAVDDARRSAASELTQAPMVRRQTTRPRPRLRADGAIPLLAGVADLRNSAAQARGDQMATIALETIYNSLALSRALVFLRQPRVARYAVSKGLGDGVERLLPALHFGDAYQADVFHAALASDRAIFIRDARDPQFARRLPAWWTAALGDASSFLILPLCRNGQAVGLLYGDWRADLPAPQLDQEHFAALNELRAVLAGTAPTSTRVMDKV